MGGIFINFKKVLIVAIFLTAIISLGCVSAADADSLSDEDVISEAVTADVDTSTVDAVETEFNDISDSDSADLDDQADDSLNPKNGLKANDLGAGEAGTFTDLYNLIQNSNTVNLDKDIVYNSTTDGEGSVIDHGTHLLVTDYTAFYIIINKNLVINGNGHTINGKNLASLFRIDGSRTVTLNNLNIVNCTSQRTSYTSDTYYGGAINAGDDSSTININNCNFTNNVAEDRAGVLYSTGNAKITIKNSNFNNNRAPQGGVIYASSAAVSVVNSNFTSNSVTGNGGVFYMSNNDLNVTNSTFKRNSANQGGIVYLNGARTRPANVMMESSIFEQNSASTNGGVVYLNNQYANADIHYDVFLNNAANVGSVLAYASLNSRILTEDDWWGTNKWNKNFINSTDSIPLMPDRRFVLSLAQSGPESATLTLELEDGTSPTGNLPLRDAIMSISNGGTITPNATQVPKSINMDYNITQDSTITATVDNQVLTLDLFFFKKDIETLTVSVDDVNLPTQPILRVTASVDGKYNVTIGSNTFEITVSEGQCVQQLSDFVEGTYFVLVSRANDPIYNDKFAYDTFNVITIKKGTYTDLQNQINNAEGVLDLPYDFAYDEDYDNPDFVNGVLISNGLTINGNGYTISGMDKARIFSVSEGVTFTLKDAVLTHGLSAEKGGAIYSLGTLLVSGSEFEFNKVIEGCGGAIYSAGITTISNSIFNRNDGGAVYVEGGSGAWIAYCNFTSNTGVKGGAVTYKDVSANVYIQNSRFDSNTASKGGAVNIEDVPTIIISNSNFTNNKAESADSLTSCGGALSIGTADSATSLNLLNSLFDSNSAVDGGAIVLIGDSTAKISGSEFIKNSATKGGAIYAEGELNLNETSFNKNTATLYGGAVYAENTLNSDDVTFTSNSISDAGGSGGALYINHGLPFLIRNNFTANSAEQGTGGAVYITGDASSYISASRFVDNSAKSGGAGAIFIDSTLFNLVFNTEFNHNDAKYGGAVIVDGEGNLSISQSTFTQNYATENAGVLIAGSASQLSIGDSSFIKNLVKGDGEDPVASALLVYAERARGADSNFTDNSAKDGSAIVWAGAEGTIIGSYFQNNDDHPTAFNINKIADDLLIQENTFVISTASISADKEVYVYDETATIAGSFIWGVSNQTIGLIIDATKNLEDMDFTIDDFTNGEFSYELKNLLLGYYTVAIAEFTEVVKGNKFLISHDASDLFTVNKATPVIEVSGSTAIYPGDATVEVTVSDGNENPLSDIIVIVTVNEVDYALKTNGEGKATLTISGLNVGEHPIGAVSIANDYYDSATYDGDAKITVTEGTLEVTVDYETTVQDVETNTITISAGNVNGTASIVITGVDSEYIDTIENVEIREGTGQYVLSGLPVGKYEVKVTVNADGYVIDPITGPELTVVPKKGTYTDLQYQIDNAVDRTLDLSYDFEYDLDYDGDKFPNGVVISIIADFYNFYFTINGNDHSICGNGLNRIFYMNAVTALKLNDLTLCHGYSEEGSAVFVGTSSLLRANNVTFTSNNATFNGGAIAGVGSISLNDCVFTNNSAAYSGGAVYSEAAMDVTNVIFDSNDLYAHPTSGEYGGAAIYSLGTLKIRNSIVSNNYPSYANGDIVYGALAAFKDTYISNVTFDNNKGSLGGAIGASGDFDSLQIYNSRFNQNVAEEGAAIFTNLKPLVVENCNFTYNSADDGALSVHADASISDSLFEGNAGASKTFNIFTEDGFYFNLEDNTFKSIVPTITTDKVNYGYGEDIQVSGNFDWGVDGYIITLPITEANGLYTHDIENFMTGDYSFTITDALGSGTYTLGIATFTDADGNKYVVDSNARTFEVGKLTTEISSEDITVYATVAKNMTFTLKDANGNVLAGKDIDVAFNGETRRMTTDDEGNIVVELNMTNKGSYSISASFAGDSNYESSFASYTVVVKAKATKLIVSDSSYSLSNTKYVTATLKAGDVPLANKVVTFSLNGKTYTGRTDASGVVKVAVALTAKKTYSVVVSFSGDSSYGTAVASYKLKVTS